MKVYRYIHIKFIEFIDFFFPLQTLLFTVDLTFKVFRKVLSEAQISEGERVQQEEKGIK